MDTNRSNKWNTRSLSSSFFFAPIRVEPLARACTTLSGISSRASFAELLPSAGATLVAALAKIARPGHHFTASRCKLRARKSILACYAVQNEDFQLGKSAQSTEQELRACTDQEPSRRFSSALSRRSTSSMSRLFCLIISSIIAWKFGSNPIVVGPAVSGKGGDVGGTNEGT